MLRSFVFAPIENDVQLTKSIFIVSEWPNFSWELKIWLCYTILYLSLVCLEYLGMS